MRTPNVTLSQLPPTERQKRIRAYNTIKRHMVPKERCEVCGEVKRLDAHHPLGYDFPKVALWVCRSCHFKLDKRHEKRLRDKHGKFASYRKETEK